MQMGKELGYEGKELQGFVKEQQDIERAERQEQRDLERVSSEEKEREKEREEKEKERVHELERLRSEEKEKERVHELAKLKAMADERAQVLANQLEIEKAKLELEFQKQKVGKVANARDPKLPYFEEGKDKMDSYLSRFEKYATANKWDESVWAAYLSALLKGRALDVYDRLSTEDAADYDKLKDALLKNFDMTERGFRKQFRYSRPEKSETFIQFSSRLRSYLEKWLKMAKIEKSFSAICDFMARDQFLESCNRELYVHLKPKQFGNLDEMAREADLFAEARGGVYSCINKGQRDSRGAAQGKQDKVDSNKPSGRSDIKCSICGKGHLTIKCFKNPDRKQLYSAEVGDSGVKENFNTRVETQGSQVKNENTQNVGRGYTRGRGNFRGSFRGRGKNNSTPRGAAHQVSFCQTEVTRKGDEIGSIFENKVGDPLISDREECSKETREGVCYFLNARLPTAQGLVNNKKVVVLRDTGCTGCVVRRSLVSDSQLIGKESNVTLIDESTQRYPLAMIDIDCPFFTGKTEALCMDDTLYDLVIGNIDGSKLPDMSHFSAAAVTRSQTRQDEKPYRKLKVPDQIINDDKEAFKQAQVDDPTLENIRKRVVSGNKTVSRGLNRGETRFIEKKGLAYREFTKGNKVSFQLVVPQSFRGKVLKLAHETLMSGHMGIRKTLDRVVTEFYWPGICGDVARFCKSCDICQRTIQKGRVTKVPLGKMPLIDTPFKRVAVDIVGPIEPRSDRKSRYILTMIDYATRYPEAIALPSIETERVAEALIEMFSRVGIPDEMLTDCGSQFTAEVMKEVSRLLSLQQLTCSPRHPICNGLIERFHATLKQMLRRMCAERPKDWDKYLPALLFAVREVPQESLGYSPFELLYGRNVRGPMAILRELWAEEVRDEQVLSTYQYVIELRERLEQTCKLARDNLKKVQIKQKAYYDKGARSRKFDVGDKVLLLLPTDSNKLLLQWKGPYEVVEVVNRMDYKIDVNGNVNTYHANILKQYVERQNVTSHCLLSVESIPSTENDDVDEFSLEDCAFPTAKQPETFKDVNISEMLTQDQRKEIETLINEYPDVLSSVPGRTDQIEHDIKLLTSEPVRSKGYAIPYKVRDVMEKEIQDMLDLGVIEPSISPYSSPVVLVPKKDGSVRFCIDFRKLNKVTEFDAEPMPNMEEVINRMSGHKYFSKLDLSKGYWQVKMTSKAKPLTAFETPKGLFQFKTMPFGLVNSGATFCRLMRKILSELSNVDSFVDDMWIFTETWKDHVTSLREVLDRLRTAKLTAKPSKCMIGYSSIECLGHSVAAQSVRPQEDKIQAIKDAPQPSTKRQIKSFLGLAGFYRRFIPNFSSIASPLTDLTKKSRPNKITDWQDHHEKAFQTLKNRLTSSPILRLPIFHDGTPFILRTDASDVGIGAVLLQEFEGEGRLPIAYASKKLLPREKNYSVIEKECLAIIWGVEKFRKYLYGVEFLLETDHKPLSYMQTAKVLNPRIMRWAMKLQPYRFRIIAIRGQENLGADYLSR
ncbi:MAG: DDE-type integrase/transposase/recombinase [Candidatus Thiodiazotropha endolucinida]|nr:DDE-type integrase/transposase/recombinase [Candidatus Thiodiazotropha endolucinida]